MVLGTEVGLDPGYIVIDWYPSPVPKRGRAPSAILRVEVENFETNFVALEQQIILVKTRSEAV